MFFSVIIPTYNRADFLTDTIASVLNQTFKDFELLIVDDGSTDATKKLVQGIVKKDSRVVYIYQENKERGAARNNGINHAKGKYAIFLDSDDIFYSNHLEVLYEYIIKYPDINSFATKYEYKKENELVPHQGLRNRAEGLYDYRTFMMENFLSCNLCVSLENDSLVLFNEDGNISNCEDWLFIVQNTRKPLYLIDQVTVCMTEHAGRSLNKSHQKTIKSRLEMTEILKQDSFLSVTETKVMEGCSYYFCAVYARLNQNKILALSFLKQSFLRLGPTKNIILLFLKIIFK